MEEQIKILSYNYADITIDFIEKLKKANISFECDGDNKQVDLIITVKEDKELENISNI